MLKNFFRNLTGVCNRAIPGNRSVQLVDVLSPTCYNLNRKSGLPDSPEFSEECKEVQRDLVGYILPEMIIAGIADFQQESAFATQIIGFILPYSLPGQG